MAARTTIIANAAAPSYRTFVNDDVDHFDYRRRDISDDERTVRASDLMDPYTRPPSRISRHRRESAVSAATRESYGTFPSAQQSAQSLSSISPESLGSEGNSQIFHESVWQRLRRSLSTWLCCCG